MIDIIESIVTKGYLDWETYKKCIKIMDHKGLLLKQYKASQINKTTMDFYKAFAEVVGVSQGALENLIIREQHNRLLNMDRNPEIVDAAIEMQDIAGPDINPDTICCGRCDNINDFCIHHENYEQ